MKENLDPVETASLPNRRLIREDEISRFMVENAENIQRLGLVPSPIIAGSTYIHISEDLQDDGHIRETEAKVPEGMVYMNFFKKL